MRARQAAEVEFTAAILPDSDVTNGGPTKAIVHLRKLQAVILTAAADVQCRATVQNSVPSKPAHFVHRMGTESVAKPVKLGKIWRLWADRQSLLWRRKSLTDKDL